MVSEAVRGSDCTSETPMADASSTGTARRA